MKIDFKDKKILIIDAETSPAITYTWGFGSKVSLPIDFIIKPSKLICVCFKYLGKKKVHSLVWDKNQDDKELLTKLGPILQEADVVIGQNSDNFDIKWFKAQFLYHRLPPVNNLSTIDTLKISRANFRFHSYKLDYMTQYMGQAGKTKVDFSLWRNVMDRNSKALKDMVSYCKTDVVETEKYLLTILPYVDRLPVSLSVLLRGNRDGCPACSEAHVTRWGFYTTRTGRYQKYKCSGCSHIFRDTRMFKEERRNL